jgi:hypothetical protein
VAVLFPGPFVVPLSHLAVAIWLPLPLVNPLSHFFTVPAF